MTEQIVSKKRHKPRLRYNHDVLPELNFGVMMHFAENKEFERIMFEVAVFTHLWQVTVYRTKGHYYEHEYD
jgi:hypothetical protein